MVAGPTIAAVAAAAAAGSDSGVTTRGEVRQLPQGAKRQGALLVNGLFALHYRIQPNFLKRERN